MKKIKWIMSKLLLVLLLMVTIVGISPIVVYAGNNVDDEENPSDYSFYTIASIASSAVSDSLGSPDSKVSDILGGLPSNAAGGFLGYSDTDKSRFITGLLQSATSKSTATYTFQQMSEGEFQSFGAQQFVFVPYMAYGSALRDAGIDGYGTGLETGDMTRTFIGGTTLLAFIMSQSVAVLFSFIIKILKLVNPFQFFANVTAGAVNAYANLGGAGSTALQGITKWISGWFNVLYDLSLVVIVFLFGFLIAMFFFVRKSGRAHQLSTYKKFIIRCAFIIFGLPLLGCTYTAVLDKLSDMLDSGNTAAVKIVASTFCDFESFVMDADMKLPPGISLPVRASNGHILYDTARLDEQDLCFSINSASQPGLASMRMGFGSDNTGGISTIIGNIQNESSGIQDDGSWSSRNTRDVSTTSLTSWVYDMLGRYMSGKKIKASDYASTWISKNWTTADKGALQEFIEASDGVNDYSDVDSAYYQSNRWTNGGNINPFVASGGPSGARIDRWYALPITISDYSPSPMSIYNYLDTEFSSSGATVYSSEKSSSDAIRKHHYSVNLVGSSIGSVVNLFTCISLLIVYTIIGWCYGFGIIMTNLKRGVRLIIAIPGGMLGSVQSIARVISYTVLMILEIVASILSYALFTELLYSVAIILISTLSAGVATAFGALAATFLGPIFGIIMIVFFVWFCIMAIKMRSVIIKTLEEFADNVVRKFIVGETQDMASSGGSDGNTGISSGAKSIAGGALAGGAIGMGLNAMGKQVQAAKDTSKQEAFVNDMLGGNGSAVSDENAVKERKRAKLEARKEKLQAITQAGTGVVRTAEGVARMKSGDVTGAADVLNGVNDVTNAVNKGANAEITENAKQRAITESQKPGTSGSIPNTTVPKGGEVANVVENGNSSRASSNVTNTTNTANKEATVASNVSNSGSSSSGSTPSNNNTQNTSPNGGSLGGKSADNTQASGGSAGNYQGNYRSNGGKRLDSGNVSGTILQQDVEDVVRVNHKVRYEHNYNNGLGDNNGNFKPNVRGQQYSTNVNDNVDVRHDVDKRHTFNDGGGNNIGEYKDNTVSQTINRRVSDRLNVTHDVQTNDIDKPDTSE